jgi:hypothetical protein
VPYTDDAKANGTVQGEGGLGAADGFYQFPLNIPGVAGKRPLGLLRRSRLAEAVT